MNDEENSFLGRASLWPIALTLVASAAALGLSLASFSATAQLNTAPANNSSAITSPSPASTTPAAPASANANLAAATPAPKPAPRLLTPAETRDNASAAGDVRPERPVTPQVSIPFGKKNVPSSPTDARTTRPANAKSTGRVDDSAARCESLAGEQVRVKCRDKVDRDNKARTPN